MHLPSPEELALGLLAQARLEKSQILELVSLLPRDEPHSATCGSAFYTGAFRKGGIVGLRKAYRNFPASTEVLARYVRQQKPSAIFSSVAVLDNVPSGFHKDVANAHCDNYVFKLSDFSGGGVWHEHENGTDPRLVNGTMVSGQVLSFADDVLRLPAHRAIHATEPWVGPRVVLVSYCLQQLHNLSPAETSQLLQLGFQPNVATGDLVDTFASNPFSQDNAGAPPAPTAQKPLVLELWAGTAGLSAALAEANFDTIAIDHKRIPGAKAAIQVADLCSEHGFSLAKRLLLHPRCIGFFAAPVCMWNRQSCTGNCIHTGTAPAKI